MMFRYLVFAGSRYYPLGGMNDCIGKFNSLGEAIVSLIKLEHDRDWINIYDSEKDIVMRHNDLKEVIDELTKKETE